LAWVCVDFSRQTLCGEEPKKFSEKKESLMFKKMVIVLTIAATLPLSASADDGLVSNIGHLTMSDDSDGIDISLGALFFSVGYEFDQGGGFSVIPTARLGFGINNDTVRFLGIDVDVELESFLAFSLRGQYELDTGLYFFAEPSYANTEIEVSAFGESITDNAWEFGVGGGIGYQFGDGIGAEAAYETFDGTDVFSLSFRIAL
jgi:opacity protein-like surface antigen